VVSTIALARATLYTHYKTYRPKIYRPWGRPSQPHGEQRWWPTSLMRFLKLYPAAPAREDPYQDKAAMATNSSKFAFPTPGSPSTEFRIEDLVAEGNAAEPDKQRLTVASIALGLATTGTLFYPPAKAACLPVLFYLGIAPAQTAYQALRQEKRATPALAETVVVAVCIVQGYYLVGAVGCWLYHLGGLLYDQQHKRELDDLNWHPPTAVWLEQAGKEYAIPVSALRAGDCIVVHTGEMIPVAGVVIDGVAWVKERGLPADAPSLCDKRQAGSLVEAATIVQVGCIWVLVDGSIHQ